MAGLKNNELSDTVFADASDSESVSSYHKWYVLVILTLVYMLSVADRNIFAVLLPHIQVDLSLSDTQMGVLSGVAFGLFYATLGLPIAVWADRSNRRNIVAASLAIFSVMTAVCGMAGTFIQMLFARMGVGVGEAGTSPPSHSMLSDYFRPDQRSLAIGILTMGGFIGMLLGFVVGGAVEQKYGWRMALYTLGAPGALLALIAWLTVKEPKRGASDEFTGGAPASAPPIRDVFSFLWKQKSYCYSLAAFGSGAFVAYGIITWMPTYLVREYQMESALIGQKLGLALFISGVFGAMLSGWLVGRMSKKDPRWVLWLPAVVAAVVMPFCAYMFITDSATVAVMCFFALSFLLAFAQPAIIVVAQSQAPANMRTVSSAILFFVSSLLGIGFGPMAAGMISDLLVSAFGNESLKYALMSLAPVLVFTSLMMVVGSKHYVEDSVRVKSGY